MAPCAAFVFIPQPICTQCQSERLEWVESSGRGTVYSYTRVHRPPRPAFEVPYVVAIVELDEGVHLVRGVRTGFQHLVVETGHLPTDQ